jgi:hypothetical protein
VDFKEKMKYAFSVALLSAVLFSGCGAQIPASEKAREWSLNASSTELDKNVIHGDFSITTSESYFNHVHTIVFTNKGNCILFYGRRTKVMLCGSFEIQY